MRQGDDGESMFVILRGKVEVSLRDAQGRSEQVATLETGGFFGEMPLMTGETVHHRDGARRSGVRRAAQRRCRGYAPLTPELAQEISAILEARRVGLASVREKLENLPQTAKPLDLLSRIQRYFSIDRAGVGASRPHP